MNQTNPSNYSNYGVFHRFGKLLKYDFLESFYSIVLINGVLLALMAISNAIITDSSSTAAWLLLLFVMPLGFLLSIAFLAITIIRLLYNRLFTSDGYLTFALPVSVDAILTSKILVSSIYVILSGVVIGLWALILATTSSELSGLVRLLGNFMDSPFLMALSIITQITSIFAMSALVLFILAILHIGAITRFKVICGIALFLFFSTIEGIISAIIVVAVGESSSAFMTLWAYTSIFNVIKCAIYYAITRYLVANKLEI
ncbi:hypothetical protein [Helicobacter sp. 23-1045]